MKNEYLMNLKFGTELVNIFSHEDEKDIIVDLVKKVDKQDEELTKYQTILFSQILYSYYKNGNKKVNEAINELSGNCKIILQEYINQAKMFVDENHKFKNK